MRDNLFFLSALIIGPVVVAGALSFLGVCYTKIYTWAIIRKDNKDNGVV